MREKPTALPPLPPPLAVAFPGLRHLHRLLWWGLAFSLVVHALFGPIVANYKAPTAVSQEVSFVTLSRRITIKLPSPTPVPTPKPTKPPTPPIPPPRSTATPERAAAQHHAAQAHLTVHVLKTSSHAAAPTRDAYRSQPGSAAGIPQGTLASASPAPPDPSASPVVGLGQAASPSAAATPASTRTPPPACAEPDAKAKVTNMAELVYPEFGAESGGSKTGDVDVLVKLTATGAITATSIYASSGNRLLDFAAQRAAQASTYSPQVTGCQSVAGEYLFHASFTLR